jgi:D-threonate/D-erythronate kinase
MKKSVAFSNMSIFIFLLMKAISFLHSTYVGATGGEILKVGIIADDLTGANDTGVQFARKGYNTSVLMSEDDTIQTDLDVIVIDTDSRDLSPEDAYRRVKDTCEFMKRLKPEINYKKIDSTMRGNIPAELDGVYDSLKPDFVIVAPGYPKNNRKVENGVIYIHNKPLHETEFANDPKSPITDSNVVDILIKGTKYNVGLISRDDMKEGMDYIAKKMALFHKNKTPYLVFDSATEEELAKIVKVVQMTGYKVVWSGSAGLANHLLKDAPSKHQVGNTEVPKNSLPVLMVVGSVNKNSRRQLEVVLSEDDVKGIMLYSHQVIADEHSLMEETLRVMNDVEQAIKNNKHIVLYSSGNPEEVELANQIGVGLGLTPKMVSEKISEVLGQLTSTIINNYEIDRLFLTGGDTAKKVCNSLGIVEFKLRDEVEVGVPIGILPYDREILTITKAGGFGSELSLLQSIAILKGDQIKCDQSLA